MFSARFFARISSCPALRQGSARILCLAALLPGVLMTLGDDGRAWASPPAETASVSGNKPALTVSATTAQAANWPQTLAANGNIAVWQEALIGAEIGPYRIAEVHAEVGDRVKKGQILLRMHSDTLHSEVNEAQAAVAELDALQSEARANSQRARHLQEKGFFSPQQGTQYLTAEQTTQARLNAARARLQAADLRLAKATVSAPDDGIISARSATVGSLTQPGQELFRLIRGGRLEWRAEVTANEIIRLKPGLPATLFAPDGAAVSGRVRAVAPTVDPQSRNALVYVDLLPDAATHVRAGMFVRGEFAFPAANAPGAAATLTLPRAAVLLRDGFSWVFLIEGADGTQGKVKQVKVVTGRQNGERIEVSSGLSAESRVVSRGVGFLADGDSVRIVAAASAATTPAGQRP